MNSGTKYLLVRADFALGKGSAADKAVYRRWRRILRDALPQLLGYGQRCPQAEYVCLHKGPEAGRYSAWLRLPIQRRPSRRRARKLKTKLRGRLELGLQPLGGTVLKLGLRRCRTRPQPLPLFPDLPPTEEAAPLATSVCA